MNVEIMDVFSSFIGVTGENSLIKRQPFCNLKKVLVGISISES